jgi:hypothetical protein
VNAGKGLSGRRLGISELVIAKADKAMRKLYEDHYRRRPIA